MPIVNRLADLAPDIAAWRRDLHAHPELQFDTPRTSEAVAGRLRAAEVSKLWKDAARER